MCLNFVSQKMYSANRLVVSFEDFFQTGLENIYVLEF